MLSALITSPCETRCRLSPRGSHLPHDQPAAKNITHVRSETAVESEPERRINVRLLKSTLRTFVSVNPALSLVESFDSLTDPIEYCEQNIEMMRIQG